MPVATSTAILVGAAVTAATTSYFGVEQMNAAGDARKARESLERQRRKELADQAAARQLAAEKAATSGQRAGLRSTFLSDVGFGSGTSTPGIGAGNLFGN